jgi:hypothetical protein
MSRVRWQPAKMQRLIGSHRSCQRRTRGSGDRPCSKKMSLPPGFRTRLISARAWATPGIVQRVNVLTTASTLESCKGMRSPGRSRNWRSSFVWPFALSASRIVGWVLEHRLSSLWCYCNERNLRLDPYRSPGVRLGQAGQFSDEFPESVVGHPI